MAQQFDPNALFDSGMATEDSIRAVQQYYKSLGKFAGAVDGRMGPQTQALIRTHNTIVTKPKEPPPPPLSPEEQQLKVESGRFELEEQKRAAQRKAMQAEEEYRREVEGRVRGDEMPGLGSWALPLSLAGGLAAGFGLGAGGRMLENRAAGRTAKALDAAAAKMREGEKYGDQVTVTTAGPRGGAVEGAYELMGKDSPFVNKNVGPLLAEKPSLAKELMGPGTVIGTDLTAKAAFYYKMDQAKADRDEALRQYEETRDPLYYERYLRADDAVKTWESALAGAGGMLGGYLMSQGKIPRAGVRDQVEGRTAVTIGAERRGVMDYERRNAPSAQMPQFAGPPPAGVAIPPGVGAGPRLPGAGAPQLPPPAGPIAPAPGPLQAGPAQVPPQPPQIPPPRSYTQTDSNIVRDMLAEATDQGRDARLVTTGQISDRLRTARNRPPPATAEIDARKAATDDYLTSNPPASGADVIGMPKTRNKQPLLEAGVATGAAGAAAAAALTPQQAEALEQRVSGLMTAGRRIEDIKAADVAGFVEGAEPAALDSALEQLRGRAGTATEGRTPADQLRAIKDKTSPTQYRLPNGQFAPAP